jgi:hypothetical protein
VSIEVLKTVACRRRAVLDGPTYLYTEWFIHVKGILNPSATSYIGFEPGDPRAGPNSNPSYTDAVIRHQLMQPRKKLIFTAAGPGAIPGDPPALGIDGLDGAGGTLVILECPPPNGGRDGPPNFTGGPAADKYLWDAQNGPFPSIFNVLRIDGLRSFHVEWACTVRVNECYNFYSSPAVLLSHRWSQTHDIDRDGYTTRSVRGHAIFRSDVLKFRNARPDDFRAALFHPVGRNMERQNVVVVAEEDNCRLSYRFEDVEVSHNVVPTHVSRIEAFAVVRRNDPSNVGIAGSVARAFLSALGGSFAGSLVSLTGILPGMAVTLVCRVWGTRRASRALLRNVATQVFKLKMPDPFAPGANTPAWGLDVRWYFDLLGRYVELQGTMTVDTITPNFGGRVSTTATVETDERFPDLVKDDIDGIALTADRPGRMAVQGNTSRGTWLAACVAQALQGTCENPQAPADSGYKDSPIPVPGAS